jgi:hypothetical protein
VGGAPVLQLVLEDFPPHHHPKVHRDLEAALFALEQAWARVAELVLLAEIVIPRKHRSHPTGVNNEAPTCRR